MVAGAEMELHAAHGLLSRPSWPLVGAAFGAATPVTVSRTLLAPEETIGRVTRRIASALTAGVRREECQRLVIDRKSSGDSKTASAVAQIIRCRLRMKV